MIIDHFGDEYLTPNLVWMNWYADSSISLLLMLGCFVFLLPLASISV
jgi:hypothetical protein